MHEVAAVLRSTLGDAAAKVPTRRMPDLVVRAMALVNPQLKATLRLLSRELTFSSAKATRVVGFAPRPADATIVDCARSLLA